MLYPKLCAGILNPHHLFLLSTITQGIRCYPSSPGKEVEAQRGRSLAKYTWLLSGEQNFRSSLNDCLVSP